MEVRVDVTLPEMGDFRWLTVGPPGRRTFAIVLMAIPGPPVMDDETAKQVRELMAKGFAGTVFLTTDDCQASYEELVARGVEFTEKPEERPTASTRLPRPVRQQLPADPDEGPHRPRRLDGAPARRGGACRALP